MKIFICWHGDNGKEIAASIHRWFPQVLHFVNPFYSKEITKGANWLAELTRELEETDYGVICLTRESASAPWIYFEAGALAKLRERSRVSSILFGITSTDTPGPLQFFQQTSFRKDDMLQLVQDINIHGGGQVKQDVLVNLFGNLWTPLEKEIGQAIQLVETPKPTRTTDQILEDLVSLVRSQLQSSAATSDQIAQKVLAVVGPRSNSEIFDHPSWRNIHRRWPELVDIVRRAGDRVDQTTWNQTTSAVEKLAGPMDNLIKRIEKNSFVPRKKNLPSEGHQGETDIREDNQGS